MSPNKFLVFVGLILSTILLLTTVGEEPSGYWAPDGYVRQADSLIRRGALTLACANLDPVERDSIIANFDEGSQEEIFFNTSYLRSDVRVFNANPRASVSPFLIEGCQLLRVNKFYHRIDLPMSPQVLWRGDVRYTSHERVTSLFGPAGQTFQVLHPSSPFEERRDTRVSVTFAGDTLAHVLLLTAPATTGFLADVTYIGIEPVLTDRRRTAQEPAILVNGFETFQGRPVRLEDGDWLRFEVTGDPQTFLVNRETRQGTASLVRLQGGTAERLYLVERDRPFVEPLSRAMDEAIREAWDQGRRQASISSVDVRLSLDLWLTEELDTRLQRWCRAQPDQVPDRPRAVSLIIMDGFTGEVRAMPSCPDEDWLDDRYRGLSDRLRLQYLSNQNLVLHPIGSAGKPFWAAAVASRFPNFLDLEIEPNTSSEVTSVLGCDLRVPFENSFPSAAWVGLESFIQNSCNRYQVLMASAALMIDGDAATAGDCTNTHADPGAMRRCLPSPEPGQAHSRLRFCDEVVNVILSTEVRGVGSNCHELKELERGFLPLLAFEAITNARTVREPPLPQEGISDDPLVNQYRTARYRIDAWRDVLNYFADEGVVAERYRVQFPFSSVSPQVTNLQLNTVRDLRANWVSLLLGGENSQWSNFQLAEAMARLMTGRSVRGRFVSEILDGNRLLRSVEPAAHLGEDSLKRGVRRRVLHAMELVVEAGTARRLRPQADRLRQALTDRFPNAPYDVYVFAKTGTPFVQKRSTARNVRVLQRLVREGNIRWNPDTQRFELPSATTRAYFNTMSPSYQRYIRDDVLGQVERDPAAFTWRPGQDVPDHPVYLEQSGRIRISPVTRPIKRRGAVLILGVLAVPRSEGRTASRRIPDWISACALNPGLRDRILAIPPGDRLDPSSAVALSTVVFIDDLRDISDTPATTSRRAVTLMGELFPALEEYLLREVALKVRRGS